MIKSTLTLLLLAIFLAISFSAHPANQVTGFKKGDDGELVGWIFSDDRSGDLDTEVLFEEQPSIRLDNDRLGSLRSYVLRGIRFDSPAETIELRAKLRTEGTGAYAGANIFLRQDIAGNAVEFSNSQPLVSANDDKWHSVRVSQAVNANSDSIVFGALLVGPGKAWVTDMQLWVDGEQLTELPTTTSTTTSENSLQTLQKIDVDWQDLNETTIHHLSKWIQVWGFLKYFHPEVAQGNFDWDLMFVESARALAEGNGLNDVIMGVLEDIGVPERSTQQSADQQDNVLFELAIDWYLHDAVYEDDVVSALQAIRVKRHTFNDSVYAFNDQMALPEFAREKQLDTGEFPDEMRLLALARLWNVLEYWFPYRENISSDWYTELSDHTATTLQSRNEFEFKKVLQGLLAQLNDSHAGLSEAIFQQGSCYLPFTVRHIDEEIVISRIHKDIPEINVQQGDRIIAIDDESIVGLLAAQLPFYSASNDSRRYYSVANELMARSCEQPTLLALSRGDDNHTVEIAEYGLPEAAHSLPGDAVQTLDSDITYLKVAGVTADAVDRAIELAIETDNLIIDVRGYPSEFILYYLGNRLTKEPLTFARLARTDPSFPGRVSMLEHTPTLTPQDPVELDGIAILVDEASISQSEFSVMAWRELPNATVIGSTTGGAIGNIRIVPLMDGLSAYFTGLRVLDKDGDDVQYMGIVPDIYIKPSLEDIRNERDIVLEKAIEVLQ